MSIHEIVDCLWEGDDLADVRSVGYRKAIKNLSDTLLDYGDEGFFERTRGYCRINASATETDYYRFLRGEEGAMSLYQGRLLSEYAWAEEYAYRLEEIKNAALSHAEAPGYIPLLQRSTI